MKRLKYRYPPHKQDLDIYGEESDNLDCTRLTQMQTQTYTNTPARRDKQHRSSQKFLPLILFEVKHLNNNIKNK